MSIVGGMASAVRRAREVEASALQVFVKNASRWVGRAIGAEEAREFRRAAAAASLSRHTLAHASYLINLGSPDETLWQRSFDALKDERARCTALGIPYLVVHPGSHMGAGERAGLARVVLALDRIDEESESEVEIVLEITAGGGTSLGGRFEQLGFVLEKVRRPERIGICFDTCHALAAGYELRDAEAYRRTFDALERSVSVSRVRAFHLNDSRGRLGSRFDRHAAIGRGQLGLEAFRLILNDPRFEDLPMVIETEKGEDLAEDRENLGILRGLVAG